MYFVHENTVTPTVSGTPSYRYPDWVNGAVYNRGDMVRDTTANCDFQCNVYVLTSTTRPGAAAVGLWERRPYGAADGSAETVATFSTTFAISNYTTWTSGSAIIQGERRYSTASHHDYEALVAISSGSNTLRPEVALTSQTPAIAGYWLDLGPSNMWSLFDADVSSKATAVGTAYTIFDITGWSSFENTDAIAIVGMENVATVVIQRLNPADNAVLSTTTLDMAYSLTNRLLKNVLVHSFTGIASGRFKISFTSAVGSPYQTIAVGKIIAGFKVPIGVTAEDVNVSIRDYSAKVFDETFGSYTYMVRGYAKDVTATVMVEHGEGDNVSQSIELSRAVPMFWDFNSDGQALTRAMIYGWYRNYSCVLRGIPWDTYSLEIAGLVL